MAVLSDKETQNVHTLNVNLNRIFICSIYLQKDDIIKVLTQHVNGQWEGELEGRRGFFPFNYVKLISPEELETLRAEKSNGPDPPT